MALTGNEVLFVTGVSQGGAPSPVPELTTTGAIAALGGGGGGGGNAVEYAVAATGAPITVPAGDTWLNMTQSGTIASQTVNLPSAPAAGQPFYCSTNGQITALTLSPSAQGWVNGSTMGSGQGFRLIYSTSTSSWTRVS